MFFGSNFVQVRNNFYFGFFLLLVKNSNGVEVGDVTIEKTTPLHLHLLLFVDYRNELCNIILIKRFYFAHFRVQSKICTCIISSNDHRGRMRGGVSKMHY